MKELPPDLREFLIDGERDQEHPVDYWVRECLKARKISARALKSVKMASIIFCDVSNKVKDFLLRKGIKELEDISEIFPDMKKGDGNG